MKVRPTRRTQPYKRRKARPAGRTLHAMLRGRTGFGHNPMDVRRATQRRSRRRRYR